MIGTLKCPYPGLTTETTSEILSQIQSSIRQKVRLLRMHVNIPDMKLSINIVAL